MEGTIGVESAMEKGSTFNIDLKAIETPGKKDLSVTEQSAPKVLPQEGGKNHTILYIEDNPDNLKLVEQVLKINKNITLISAPQAEIGIDLARAHDVDLILMDINLPGMDGVEAMKILRRIESTRDLPILALSANAMKRDIQSALNAGFTDYIVKPINVPEFLEKINSFLF